MIPVIETPKPTQTIHFRNNFVNVVTKLYGPVSPARMASEQAVLRYRVDQLSPLPKRQDRVEEEDFDSSYMVPGLYV